MSNIAFKENIDKAKETLSQANDQVRDYMRQTAAKFSVVAGPKGMKEIMQDAQKHQRETDRNINNLNETKSQSRGEILESCQEITSFVADKCQGKDIRSTEDLKKELSPEQQQELKRMLDKLREQLHLDPNETLYICVVPEGGSPAPAQGMQPGDIYFKTIRNDPYGNQHQQEIYINDNDGQPALGVGREQLVE